jgi:hypothetical protein
MKIAVRRRFAVAAVLSMTATVGAVALTTTSSSADFSAGAASPPAAGNYPTYPGGQPVGVTFTVPLVPTPPQGPVPPGSEADWQLVGDTSNTFTSPVDSNSAPGNKPHTTVNFSDVNDPTATPRGGVLGGDGPADPGAYLVKFVDPASGTILQNCGTPSGCFTVVAAGAPGVASAAPNQVAAGAGATKVTFKGSNFSRNSSFRILPVAGNSSDITIVKDTTSTSPGSPSADGTTWNAVVTIPAAAQLGTRDIQVTNTDGQTTTCVACFTVLGASLTSVSPQAATNNDTDSARSITFAGPTGSMATDGAPSLQFVGDPGVVTKESLTIPGSVTSRAGDGSSITATYNLAAAAPGNNVYQPRVQSVSGSTVNVCGCRFSIVQSAAPTVTSISPSAQDRGTTQQVTVGGTNFSRGANVIIAGGGVTTTSVEYVSRTQLKATLAVASAAASGARDVQVKLTDGQTGTKTAGYTLNGNSPNPSATPTATISPSSSATPTLTIAIDPSDITPGIASGVSIHGKPNTTVDLYAYSRPSTTYGLVRSDRTDANGDVMFSVKPGANTRLYAHYKNGTTTTASNDSPSAVIHVHTALSLSAYRDGVRKYHFQGTNLPRRPGQLITLYRIDNNGLEIRTATVKTDSTGTWRIYRTFTGSGTFTFVVRTSATNDNAAGRSNERVTVIH